MSKALKRNYLAAVLVLSMGICGCGSAQHQGCSNSCPLPLDIVDTGVYGPRTDPQASIQWIATGEQIQKIIEDLDKQGFSKTTVSLKDINLDRWGLLLVEMGQKPTGGYSVSLNKAFSCLSNETAVICLNWNTPNADALSAQVMTSPYLIVKLPKGKFKKVVVLDHENIRLFEIETPG